MPLNGEGWKPSEFHRFIESLGTATRTALVDTDLGTGYLKGLGNPEGPQALAAEYIGSELASWLGLKTLDYAVMNIRDTDEIPLRGAGRVLPGPAFISRNVDKAQPWDGTDEMLGRLSNPEAVSGLVVIDTWIRNCDRSSPDRRRRHVDNVLFIWEPKPKRRLKMVAMDFTHAFNCGNEITHRIANVEFTKDERLFGIFPEFEGLIEPLIVGDFAEKLGTLQRREVEQILNAVPVEWEINGRVRSSLLSFILDRARFLSAHIEQMLRDHMNPITGGA